MTKLSRNNEEDIFLLPPHLLPLFLLRTTCSLLLPVASTDVCQTAGLIQLAHLFSNHFSLVVKLVSAVLNYICSARWVMAIQFWRRLVVAEL